MSTIRSGSMTVVLFALLSLMNPAAGQDSALWSILALTEANSDQPIPAIDSLPERARPVSAVRIESALLSRLSAQTELLVTLPDNRRLIYRREASDRFPNGDYSWRGVLQEGGQTYGLSLVVSAREVLVTLYTPGGLYYLHAAHRDGDERATENLAPEADPAGEQAYAGWLYTFGPADYLPPDAGAYLGATSGLQDQLALSNSDVSITQRLSNDHATIGDLVRVDIDITNNLNSTLSNEQVNVLFIAEFAEFVSSDSGCALSSTGIQPSIRCTLNPLSPSGRANLDFTVRITEASYPQVASSVFVGNLASGQYARNDAFVFVNRDTLTDSDGDGYSDFNEALVGTDANNPLSALPADYRAEVDLMFLYTPEFIADINGQDPQTRINQIVSTTNGFYADSGVGIEFRPVHYGLVNTTVNNLNNTMNALVSGTGAFSDVSATRADVGADIVVVVGGYVSADSSCGLGKTPGVGFNGEIFHPQVSNPGLYTVIYLNGFPPGGGSGCSEDTLAHELGHNFGLVHSRREAGAQGTLPWSHGYGVDGSFTTIMAYSSRFNGATSIPRFSDPNRTDCNGQRCGVARNDLEQAADAVHSLNHTRFQIAARRPTRLLDVSTLSGEASGLLIYGGATLTGNIESQAEFSNRDSFDVTATLQIPSADRGKVGELYTVIAVAGVGLYFRDANGAYQFWNGDLATLQSAIIRRPLEATETLRAFENFAPASVGVSSADVTVYFAYAVPDEGVFVYSTAGLPFRIR